MLTTASVQADREATMAHKAEQFDPYRICTGNAKPLNKNTVTTNKLWEVRTRKTPALKSARHLKMTTLAGRSEMTAQPGQAWQKDSPCRQQKELRTA